MAANTQTAERLSDLLAAAGPMDGRRALAILRQISEQLAELHAAGRIDRAIRADRIVVEGDAARLAANDNAAEAEFDNASLPPELGNLDLPQLPERIEEARAALRAARSDADPRRIDVYQLGCLACEMLTGSSPQTYLFSPRGKARVIEPWRRVLDGMLGYNPALRFATCAELESEFERIANNSPPAVSPETPPRGTGIDALTNTPRTPHPAATSLPFTKLDHYQIIARLGSGGMGDVYRGHDSQLDRTVALKVLPPELARQSDFVRRFTDEAKAAARIVHPNVVQIYSIGEDEGRHYFAMQHVAGETLAARMSRVKRLSLDDALAIIEQVLSGLAVAHRQGMIHRDIKPGNILLDAEHGRALLADFGLVKSLDSSEQMTATGMVMGTVDYISPEQGRGQKVDTRSDLYSVGVLLYQMLSGHLPFVAESATAMIFQHAYEKPRPLEDAVPDIATGASAIVCRLLAKDPANRYQTADDLLADVRALHAAHNWQPAPVADAKSDASIVIATLDADFSDDDRRLTVALAPLPPPRWQDQLRVLFHLHAPALVKNLQNTEQQVDGALAVYQARRDKLAGLAHEAAAVERQLAEQGLDTELHQQRAASEEIQLRLAKADATLQKLRSQQALLRARLRAVEADNIIAGVRTHRPAFRLRFLVAAILAIAAQILLTHMRVGRSRIDVATESQEFESKKSVDAPPVPILPAAGWVGLTPFIDTRRDSSGGTWESVDNAIRNQPLASPSISNFLKIPVSIHGSYELRFKYQVAAARSRGFNIRLPMHHTRGALVIGQTRQENGIGINGIQGLSSINASNPTGDPKFENPPDVEREALVRVESTAAGTLHIAVMIDGRKQIDWSGNESNVLVADSSEDSLARQRLKLPDEPILVLHGWGHSVTIRQLALRMLDGSATPFGAAVPTPNIADSKSVRSESSTAPNEAIQPAAGWVNLVPDIDLSKDTAGGIWSVVGDSIHVANQPGTIPARTKYLKIPFAIRGSYEFRFKYKIARNRSRGLSVRLPIGQARGVLLIGQSKQDTGLGINGIKGLASNDPNNPTGHPDFANPVDVEREAFITVDSGAAGAVHVTVSIDGQKQIDWAGNEADVNIRDSVTGMKLPKDPMLILGGWGMGVTFRQPALRMLDGKAIKLSDADRNTPIQSDVEQEPPQTSKVLLGTVPPLSSSPTPSTSPEVAPPDDWEWSKPVNAGPVINSNENDSSPFLSADGLTLLFDSERPGGSGGYDIWMSQRASVNGPWGAPVNLGPTINSELSDYHPSMTANGLMLVFSSNRPGGVVGDDLYMSIRQSAAAPWGKPINLGRPINTDFNERGSCISSDGLTLIIGTDRPGNVGRNDLLITRRKTVSDRWGKITNLGSLVNSSRAEKSPQLSADGLTLVYHSDRAGGFGKYDIYMATRRSQNEPFSKAMNLGPIVNSAANEDNPAPSPDGQTLWFSSDRTGNHDLWYSQRVKRATPAKSTTPLVPLSVTGSEEPPVKK